MLKAPDLLQAANAVKVEALDRSALSHTVAYDIDRFELAGVVQAIQAAYPEATVAPGTMKNGGLGRDGKRAVPFAVAVQTASASGAITIYRNVRRGTVKVVFSTIPPCTLPEPTLSGNV